jgi:hypothetical protein
MRQNAAMDDADAEPPYLHGTLTLLQECHEAVEALFARFETAEDPKTRRALVEAALHELKVHAAIEELLLHPALEPELVAAEKEPRRHVRRLIAELEEMTGEEARHDAKFALLSANVRRHIGREKQGLLEGAAREASSGPARPARPFAFASGLGSLTLLGFGGRFGAEAAERPHGRSYALDT